MFSVRFDTDTEIISCIKCRTEKYLEEAWKNKRIENTFKKNKRGDTLKRIYIQEAGVVEREGRANGA